MLSERRFKPRPCAETEIHMNDLRISQRVDVRTAEPPATSLDPGASCGSVPGLSRHDHGLRQAATPVGDVMTGRRNILLVDDSDPVRETLADLLEVEGFQTAQAASAAEAMTLLRQDPGFDVLVTDLSMPGEDGISLIQQARQFQPNLPAILLTGYADEATSVAVVAGGSCHVLRKPVEGDRLIEQITALMQRPRPA
jgi:CheY-like chemotaxis protein